MTIHIDARDFGGMSPPRRTSEMLAAVACLIRTSARKGWRGFLEGLHKSRQQQAAIEFAKHRTLMCDPATGISFGIDATTRYAAPPE